MRQVAVAVLLIAAALAGCLGAGEESTPASTEANATAPEIIVDENRPDPTAGGNVTLGEVAPLDLEATLLEVPKIEVGEWWRIRMMSPLDGTDVEIVRVMAKEDGGDYIFGMPHEGWYKEAVVYHAPGFGEVKKEDLSFSAHNIPFQPLNFPLEDGKTWTTNFEDNVPLTATVSVVDEYTADVVFTNPDGATVVSLTYDARIHEVSRFEVSFLTYEVVAHGYDFEGWVTVPKGIELVFFHGRIANAVDPFLQPNPVPMEEVTIDEEFNRVTFVQMAGPIAPAPGTGAGVFRETVTDPAGNMYVTESTDGKMKIQFFEANQVKGTWKLEHLGVGAGMVFTEGIAYHQYDIRVPDGAIRTDHSHPVIR